MIWYRHSFYLLAISRGYIINFCFCFIYTKIIDSHFFAYFFMDICLVCLFFYLNKFVFHETSWVLYKWINCICYVFRPFFFCYYIRIRKTWMLFSLLLLKINIINIIIYIYRFLPIHRVVIVSISYSSSKVSIDLCRSYTTRKESALWLCLASRSPVNITIIVEWTPKTRPKHRRRDRNKQ